MKIYIIFGFVNFLLFGCVQSNDRDLSNINKIKVKCIASDKESSKGLILCTDYEFNTMNSCYYKIDSDQYVKEFSYVFDTRNSISEFYKYLPEGPLIYDLQDLEQDTLFAHSYNFFKQRIEIQPTFIIDSGDTITNFNVFKNPNVILAGKSNFKKNPLSKGRIVIYEY